MERKGRGDEVSGDRDGVRVYDQGRGVRAEVVVIAILVATAIGGFFLLRREDLGSTGRSARDLVETERPQAPKPPGRVADAAQRIERKPFFVRRRPTAPEAEIDVPSRQGTESAPADAERLEVPAGEYIAVLRESGETAGLAAFPPPGTNPPRSGVVVPADYELPEGFARHYQTTDDGHRLDPVLVVAPGYEIVDEDGEPVELTDQRIVPPEFAPPDLPLEMLEVPPAEGASSDR